VDFALNTGNCYIIWTMSIFSVSTAKEKALTDKMEALNIREEDIEETFIRSSGKGGQHVNKTSTCVYLKHLPTGLEVKCQQGRSQALNRYQARVLLASKIEQLIKGRESEEIQRIEKIRRQKRKRSKRAKEKMLAEKKIVSEKKKLRTRPVENNV
jgi:peptide chain release factor